VKVRASAFALIADNKTAADREEIIAKLISAQSAIKTSKAILKSTEKLAVSEIPLIDDHEEIINFELKSIEAPELHKNTKNWIIFSDLHVKR
jgi:uncharacterized protein with WD repeat